MESIFGFPATATDAAMLQRRGWLILLAGLLLGAARLRRSESRARLA
jgi:hypothetical protein